METENSVSPLHKWVDLINAWQDERDEEGNFIRPWTKNTSPDPLNPDPLYILALGTVYDITTNLQYAHMTNEEKLEHADRRMAAMIAGYRNERPFALGVQLQ